MHISALVAQKRVEVTWLESVNYTRRDGMDIRGCKENRRMRRGQVWYTR